MNYEDDSLYLTLLVQSDNTFQYNEKYAHLFTSSRATPGLNWNLNQAIPQEVNIPKTISITESGDSTPLTQALKH